MPARLPLRVCPPGPRARPAARQVDHTSLAPAMLAEMRRRLARVPPDEALKRMNASVSERRRPPTVARGTRRVASRHSALAGPRAAQAVFWRQKRQEVVRLADKRRWPIMREQLRVAPGGGTEVISKRQVGPSWR